MYLYLRVQTQQKNQTSTRALLHKHTQVNSLCNLGHAVRVVSGDLLRHHAAHGELQLQQRRPQPVVLQCGGEETKRVFEKKEEKRQKKTKKRGSH